MLRSQIGCRQDSTRQKQSVEQNRESSRYTRLNRGGALETSAIEAGARQEQAERTIGSSIRKTGGFTITMGTPCVSPAAQNHAHKAVECTDR